MTTLRQQANLHVREARRYMSEHSVTKDNRDHPGYHLLTGYMVGQQMRDAKRMAFMAYNSDAANGYSDRTWRQVERISHMIIDKMASTF